MEERQMNGENDRMLSVGQVIDLPPGDDQNASWISPGFVGVVRRISERSSKNGRKFWPCIIADETGNGTIEVSVFAVPSFREGDTLEFSGKGLRRTEYQGKAQATIGRETAVRVVERGGRQGAQKQNTPAPRETAGPIETNNADQFHRAMKRQALLLTHSWMYARMVIRKLEDEAGFHFTSDEQAEATRTAASSLFIEGNRKGLDGIVCPIGTAPPQAEPAQRRSPPAAPPPHGELDEDVPF
jgi:hypothetical protein